jgi:glycosyltransferase involved in cell wall biosynthesis
VTPNGPTTAATGRPVTTAVRTDDAPVSPGGPLRVLVVTVAGGGIGGMQRHTHDLVRGLVAAGHDVEVACPYAEELEPDLYGARWTLLETVGRSPEWSRLVVAAYDAAMARGTLDVIHSESTSALPLLSPRVSTPMTIGYQGNYIGHVRAQLRRAKTRPRSVHREARQLLALSLLHFGHGNAWAFRRCESMVPSRQQLRETSRSHFTRRERFHVVPNGIDVKLFRPDDRQVARKELGIGDGIVLATVGRLDRAKGFDVALEAFARVAPGEAGVRLLIVGDGDERAPLETLALRLGVADRTEFVGAQPAHRVARYLAASDVFLFPTRYNEAGPLVLPEAMACGLPVIASRTGAVTEVLEPPAGSPVGILVPPGSLPDVDAALRRVIEDPTLRSTLGTAARERALSEYSLDTMILRTVAVYRTAIARDGLERR